MALPPRQHSELSEPWVFLVKYSQPASPWLPWYTDQWLGPCRGSPEQAKAPMSTFN